MSEIEIDYLEPGPGPGVVELPEHVDEPGAQTRVGVDGEDLALYPGWELDQIEIFLKGIGAGVHELIGQTERDWLMTKADLERMAPPLTRIANRWEPAVRLSPLADPILFTYGGALYTWRNALAMQRARKERRAAEEATGGAGYEYSPPGEDAAVGSELELAGDVGLPARQQPYFPESPRAQESI